MSRLIWICSVSLLVFYEEMSGDCYMIFHTKLSWHDSEAACKRTGANFASIASIRDQQFLAGNLSFCIEDLAQWSFHLKIIKRVFGRV